jgi:hypothetical protein
MKGRTGRSRQGQRDFGIKRIHIVLIVELENRMAKGIEQRWESKDSYYWLQKG